jgi:hypothetical protein
MGRPAYRQQLLGPEYWSAGDALMLGELAAVTERIILLLDRIERGDYPDRAYLEKTLTDGYACALALDAECDRIERRLAERAAALSATSGEDDTRQLSALARLLVRRRRELASLRGLVSHLRAGVQEASVA